MKSTAYYIKTSILALLLFIESLLLAHSLLKYVAARNYFTPDVSLIVQMGLLLLALLYTQTLTIGAWDKKVQFLLIPLPIALGVSIVFLGTGNLYGQIGTLLTLLLTLIYTFSATNTMKLLTKFKPTLIMLIPTRGLLLAFALVAATLVAINPGTEELDIGQKLGEIANTQMEQVLQSNPNLNTILQSGILEFNIYNIPKEVATGVNEFIEPYKDLFGPLIAILVFLMAQGLGIVVIAIYTLTINPIFLIAQKIGFFNVEEEKITRERLTF